MYLLLPDGETQAKSQDRVSRLKISTFFIMRLDLRPNSVSDRIPFQACSQRALEGIEFANAHSGLSEDGVLTWLYKGAVLEVVNTTTGYRVTSLHVEHLLKDKQASIVQVCEFPCQGRARLLVGVNGTSEEGLVLMLDIASSLIVKAVKVPQQVTAIERVLTHGGSGVPAWALSEQLRCFHGIVAVGACGGYVYLIDMMIDGRIHLGRDNSNRPVPSTLFLLDPRERDITTVRQKAVSTKQHMALCLGVDEQMNSNDCFHFRRPDLSVLQSYNEDEVKVSSLRYIPQSGTLAVGYSFGGFHLWKLFNPVLEYACTPEPEDLPVAFFVYQEPENDPKHFAYLWVCRDDCISEEKQDSLCGVSLYQLSYANRTFYANYGNFYDELNSCILRLDHVLTFDPFNSRNTNTTCSRLLSAVIIADPNYHPSTSLTVNDSFDEGLQGPDLSLCAFVWEADDARPGNDREVFLAIFDMNRWYHAQMPSRIKCVNLGGQEVCPFLAVYSMSEAVQGDGNGTLLKIGLKPGSLLRFVNNSPMPPEQHYYPSSLAFELICVMSSGIVYASALGLQRQVLASLEASGPDCLLKPFDIYQRCLQTGLLARSSEAVSAATSDEQYRKSLLTLALEYDKIRFITACIRTWADGDFYQQGCTLQFLLSWVWGRVTAVKQQIDVTCQPLFNWSGAPVDRRMLQVLHSNLCCLGHMKTVLHAMLNLSTPLTDQGHAELEHRVKVLTLLHRHLKVILWFVHNALLPENDENSELTATRYVYPATALRQVFEDQRRRITHGSRTTATHEVILIDAVVHAAGLPLVDLWKNQGGTGMYPPPSLYAAMSMLLLDSVQESMKDAILIYLLFDMANAARGLEQEIAEKIPQFVQAFDIQLGFTQQIHGFWLIDHMNFEDGIPLLLHHSSSQVIGSWQHGCILQSLFQQGELAAAARYLSLRNPPVLTAEDLKTRLTILVANRLVWQAVSYVRHSCGTSEKEAMLRHVFLQCQQCKLLELLFKLPLEDEEEQCLQCYLSQNTDTTSSELLVLHLLQRAQYVPAIRLNDRMKHRATMDVSAKARDRSKTRNAVIDGYRHSLPAAQQYLISHPPSSAASIVTRKIDVPRPKPLSTAITGRAEVGPRSRSALVLAVLEKVAEARTLLAAGDGGDDAEMEGDAARPSASGPHSSQLPASEIASVNKPGPFLCTPSTPRIHSRLSLGGQKVYPSILETSMAALKATTTPPTAGSEAETNRQSRIFTADCMSLLLTPKISRSPVKPSTVEHRHTAPHSILKVSRLPRSSSKLRVNCAKMSPGVEPKRLGFSLSQMASPSLSPTPTTLTPTSTPSPICSTDPQQVPSNVQPSSSASSLITPRHIRFAQPEMHEISPLYVSPNQLARPPLHSFTESDSQQHSSAGEMMVTSDEDITFNMSRQVAAAEPMDTTADLSVPVSPAVPPTTVQHSPSPSPLPSTQPSTQPKESASLIQHTEGTIVSDKSCTAGSTAPSLEDVKFTLGLEREVSSGFKSEESSGSEMAEPSIGDEGEEIIVPMIMTPEGQRDRSPFGEQGEVEILSKERRDASVSPNLAVTRQVVSEAVTSTKSFLRSVQSQDEQVQVSSSSTLTTSSTSTTTLIVEWDDVSDAPTHSVAAMETIDPGEEKHLLREREKEAVGDSMSSVPWNTLGMVELSDDEEEMEEIQIPTPITTPVVSSITPRRGRGRPGVKPGRRSKFTVTSSLDALSRGEEKEEGSTPPKLQRRGDGQELMTSAGSDDVAAAASEGAQSVTEKPEAEASQAESTDSLRPESARRIEEPSQAPLSPGRSTRSSVEFLSSVTRHSPPVSPSRQSSRKKMDTSPSPPATPLRRSTRKSADRIILPPPSPSRRTAHKEDDEVQLPPSSSRLFTLRATPERSSNKAAEKSDTQRSPGRRAFKAMKFDTEHEGAILSAHRSSGRSQTPEPAAALSSRRSKSRSQSPEAPVIASSPGRRSKRRSPSPEPPVVSAAPSRKSKRRSPSPDPASSSRSLRSSHTPEMSHEPPSPSRLSTRRSHTPEVAEAAPVPASPSRRSTRQSQTMEPAAERASPSRRSKTPERTVVTRRAKLNSEDEGDSEGSLVSTASDRQHTTGRSTRSPSRSTRSPARTAPKSSQSEKEGESDTRSSSHSAGRSTHIGSEESVTLITRSTSSPARSSRKSSQSDEDSVSERSTHSLARSTRAGSREPVCANPTTAHSQKQTEDETMEPSTISSVVRTRHKSKTPERSPARLTILLRGKGQSGEGEGAESEVKVITTETEEATSMEQNDSTVPATSLTLEEIGDAPSFKFAPPTPLTRLQADPTLAASSDLSAFVFSPPISRAVRNISVSSSSTRLESEVAETEPVSQEAESAPKKAKHITTARQKKQKKIVPGASPTDSPINIISPGQSSQTPAALVRRPRPAISIKSAGVTRARKLKKLAAKLW